MVAILYPRRLYELRDVTQPGIGLPDQGVPQLQSSNSSFVVETIAAGGAFSLGASNLGNTLGDTGVTGTRVVLAGTGNVTLSQATDLAGGTISISVGTAAGAAFSAGVSNLGNTLGNTGATGTRLVFAGGNSITLSQLTDVNGGTITISGATTSQSAQTAGLFDLTISGNTAGVGALISSGTLTLAGGNSITLSQNGNAITISGATTSQSVQPETQTFIGGISASNTVYTSGTVNLVGTGNITVASGTGQRVIISGSQSVQPETQTFVGGIAASDTTYTSGTVRITGVGGGVTVSSNTGQRVDISVAAPVAQSVQTQNMVAVTLSGNTSGALALMSSGTMTIAGGNNITVSQAGNAFTISGPNVGGAQTGISGIIASDATYTSGTVQFTGSNMITVKSSAGQRVVIDATQSVQPETQTFVGGIAASDTTYTSGTVRITGVGGGVTVSSNTGQRVDISVAAQSVQTQSAFNLTISGNTSGAGALISSGTMTLAGGNNITVSQAGNAITISGPNVGGAQTGISGIANSQTTYTSGTVSLSELGAITIRSTTGNQFQFSVAAQSAESQSIGMSNLGNTSGTTGIASGAQVRMLFAGGNNITLSQSLNGASGTITISAFNQSVQPETQTFVGGLAASNTTYTSGTITITGVGGGITVSSNTGQRIDLSVAAQTGTQFSAGLSNIGNTSGDTGTVAGRVVLAGGNNITLSGSTNGVSETITISAGAGGGFSAGVSNVGNTSGDTGITGSRLVLAGGNAITLSQSTNASGGTVTISAPTQTVESQSIGMSNVGNTSGTTGVASGGQVRFVLAGGNNITLSQSLNGASGTVTISAFSQTVQTQNMIAATISGNTSGALAGISSGTLTLAGGNNITLSQAGNAVTISAFNQTGTQFSAGLSNIGNTSGDTVTVGGRLILAGGNGITLSGSSNGASETITISGITQSVESQSIGMSNIGNTSGTTGIASGGQVRFLFAGGNNITLSQSLNGASGTITISAPNLGAGAMSVGLSNLGNTAGSTGVTGTRLVLVGTNNISLSQSTDANGGTVSINNTVSAFLAGVSTGGNTTGDTGVTGTRMVFVGSSPVSLSQATGANGGTITINAPATSSLVGTNGISVSTNGSTISVMQVTQTSLGPFNGSPVVTGQQGQGTLHLSPIQLPNIQFDRIGLGVQISNASNSSFSITLSQWVGLYTKNASTLSLLVSTSGQTNFSGSGTVGSYSLYGGPKMMTIPWTTTLTGNDYYIGIVVRTTTGGGAGHSISQLCVSRFTNSAWSGILGAGSNATDQAALGLGVYTATTSGIPDSIAFTQLNGSGSMVLRQPIWQIRSGTV